MTAPPLPAARNSYWELSRSPRYSLTFALPLLVLYEVMATAINGGALGIRNGADVLLKALFADFLGPRGPLIFAVALVSVMVTLIVRDRRRHPGRVRWGLFPLMLLEASALAMIFGAVVGLVASQLVNSIERLAIGGGQPLPTATRLMVSLGAGLYEELLFRVVLVSAMLWISKRVLGLGPVASGTIAVTGSALIFAAFHYVGPYGDKLEVGSFVFRTVAGLAFSGLYVARGFGITAWTHALYDVFLLAARAW